MLGSKVADGLRFRVTRHQRPNFREQVFKTGLQRLAGMTGSLAKTCNDVLSLGHVAQQN